MRIHGRCTKNPGWCYNLKSNPDTSITVAKRSIAFHARELEGVEREDVWARFKAHDDRWSQYEQRADRQMPLMALELR